MSELVAKHYERTELVQQLASALANAGLADDKKLSLTDLAPLDHFHARGFEATEELAQAIKIDAASEVLDIGSGLGGPARYLASKFGCHVHGIDLTQSYVDAANYLAERAGMSDKVTFQCANALALPYPDGTFDLVWTQHVAMNVADRKGLYAEAHRVLKPGGQLALYDVIAGAAGPVHFPVPWSAVPETSFLVTAEELRALMLEQGFEIALWKDRTADSVAWFAQFKKNQADKPSAPPLLGLNVIVGPDFAMRAANLGRSLTEGRAGILEAVLIKK